MVRSILRNIQNALGLMSVALCILAFQRLESLDVVHRASAPSSLWPYPNLCVTTLSHLSPAASRSVSVKRGDAGDAWDAAMVMNDDTATWHARTVRDDPNSKQLLRR